MSESFEFFEHISALGLFLTNQFPWITLIALLATTILLALKEKRKRALILGASEEEKRILAMENISEAEKQALLRAANPLPEVSEAFPLPDFPLRLTAALAKTFSLLKILAFAAILLFWGYTVLAAKQANQALNYNADKPILGILLLLFFLVLAGIQFWSSTQITRGNLRARNFLVVMALLDLPFYRYHFTMPHAWLAFAMIACMSAYSLWTLLLRPENNASLSFDTPPTASWKKQLGLCLLVCFLFACFVFDFEAGFGFSSKFTTSKSRTNCSISSSFMSSNNSAYTTKHITLLAGDPSEETQKFLQELKQKLSIPASITASSDKIRFLNGEVLLLVSKTKDEKIIPEKTKKNERHPDISAKAWKQIMRSLEAETGPSGMVSLNPGSRFKNKLVFEITTLFGSQKLAGAQKTSLLHNIGYTSLSISEVADYTGDKDKLLQKISAEVADKLNEHFTQVSKTRNLIELPPSFIPKQGKEMVPKFKFLETSTKMLSRHSLKQEQITLFRLAQGATASEQIETIEQELKQAGWEKSYDGSFSKGKEKIHVFGHAPNHWDTPLPRLWAVYSRSAETTWTREDAVALCKSDFKTFMFLCRAELVDTQTLKTELENYLQNQTLPSTDLLMAHSLTEGNEELEPYGHEILCRATEVLLRETRDESYFDKVKAVFGKIKKMDSDNKTRKKIVELFGDSLVSLQLEKDEATGFLSTNYSAKGINDNVFIFALKSAGDQPGEDLFFLAFSCQATNGQNAYFTGGANGGSHSSKTDETTCRGKYTYDKRDNTFSFTSAGTFFGTGTPSPERESYEILLEMNRETNEFKLRANYNPETKICRDFPIRILDDGRYEFEGKIYALDDLVALWQKLWKGCDVATIIITCNRERHREFQSWLQKKITTGSHPSLKYEYKNIK